MKYNNIIWICGILSLASFCLKQICYAEVNGKDSPDNYRKEAMEILAKYGGIDSLLSKEELRIYLADQEFENIDGDENGYISYEEYLKAYLYCERLERDIENTKGQLWMCRDEIAEAINSQPQATEDNNPALIKYRKEKQLAGGKLTSSHLLSNEQWKKKIAKLTDVKWDKIKDINNPNQPLTVEGVATYLMQEDNDFLKYHNKDYRMDKLRKFLNIDAEEFITKDQFFRFRKHEIFMQTDTDGNNAVDIAEIQGAFKTSVIVKNFIALAQKDESFFLYNFDKLNGTTLEYIINDKIEEEWLRLFSQYPSKERVSKLDAQFAIEEKAHLDEQKGKEATKLLGGTWIKGTGLILEGDRSYNKKTEKESLDYSKEALTLKFIKNFTNSGVNADPGTFSWVKDDGEDHVFGFEFAVRFDYYDPDWYNIRKNEIRPAFGLEINKSGSGDKKKDEHRFYLLGDLFISHDWNFWKASRIQFGPYLEFDNANDDDKVTGLIEWEPQLNILGFNTGVYYPLFGSDNYGFFFRPIFALEIDSYFNTSDNSDAEDNTLLRYGLHTGLRFYKQIEISHKARQRHIIDNWDKDSFYHETSARWTPDPNEWIYFEVAFKKGKESPDDDSIEQYSSSIGVKF